MRVRPQWVNIADGSPWVGEVLLADKDERRSGIRPAWISRSLAASSAKLPTT